MKIIGLLDQVAQGNLSVSDAVEKIHAFSGQPGSKEMRQTEVDKKSKWLKIKIVDPEKNFRMHLPPLPIAFAGRLAAYFIKFALRHSENSDLKSIPFDEILFMLEILKTLPPVHLVSIQDGQGIFVEIYTL